MSADITEGRSRPLDPEVLACPDDYFARLHAHPERVFDEGQIGMLVPGHADLFAISKDTGLFSSNFQRGEEAGPDLMGVSPEPYSDDVKALLARCPEFVYMLVMADPPAHTRHRALMLKALNPTRIRTLEPWIQLLVDELLDACVADGRCEFVQAFAAPLPLTIIARTLGVDSRDMHDFKRWSGHIMSGHVEQLDNTQRAAAAQSLIEFGEYFLPRIEERRAHPSDASSPEVDLLSDIVNAELDLEDLEAADGERIEGPRRLTTSEVLSAVTQLLAAGNHSTTSLLTNAMVQLTARPDVADELRGAPGLVPDFVEESLRMAGPVQHTYRRPTRDTEIAGCPIAKNTMVNMHWGASGHDPQVFPDPTTLDIHRPNLRKHLSFGHGRHFCVGSGLARTQTRIAYETILRRMGDIRLVDASPYMGFGFSGYERVEITFTPRA